MEIRVICNYVFGARRIEDLTTVWLYISHGRNRKCIQISNVPHKEQQTILVINTAYLIGYVPKKKLLFFHTFLKPTKCTLLIYYTVIFLTVKSVQHVSVPYFGTIIRDPYRELHKITDQEVMVHIKNSRGKM
jgi:hypothetical protein